MKKIDQQFIIDQYRSGIDSYSTLTTKLGLWASEEYIFGKYLNAGDAILDLGCGTGRTTFALYNKGYKNIIGVDLTPEMIQQAKQLNPRSSHRRL